MVVVVAVSVAVGVVVLVVVAVVVVVVVANTRLLTHPRTKVSTRIHRRRRPTELNATANRPKTSLCFGRRRPCTRWR